MARPGPPGLEAWGTIEPYLRRILRLIGIDGIQTVKAEGMKMPPLAIYSIRNGEKADETRVILRREPCSVS